MTSEIPLLRAIVVKLGGVDVGGSEVPTYKAIVKALGGEPAFSSEVGLLRQIVKLSGGAGNGGTEVPLMKEWAQALGVTALGDTEVPLLWQILENISSGPHPPVDPLAGITGLVRFQSRRGEITGFLDAIRVSGAGSSEMDGLYYWNGSDYAKEMPINHVIRFRSEVNIWSIGDIYVGWYYSGTPTELPQDAIWSTFGEGVNPPPTVTAVQVPIYKPLGLYQDTACTIPALEEWDAVAAAKDEIGGTNSVSTQGEESRQPTLQFSNGVPVILFDGLDDWLDPSVALGVAVTYTCIIRSVTLVANSYWSPFDLAVGTGFTTDRFGLFATGSNEWHNDPSPASVRRNGVNLSAPYVMNPFSDWQALTVKTNTPFNLTPRNRGIGLLENAFFGNFECCFFFVHAPTNTPEQIAAVDAYAQTLIPAP